MGPLGLVFVMDPSQTRPQPPSDRRIVPPVERSFASANAEFRLRIATTDGWKTREPLAELRRGDRVLWSRRIPNSHGPRDAVVLDSGGVVLLDEWINIASTRAITLLGLKGQERAVFSYTQIRAALGVPGAELSDRALAGPYGRGTWMAGRPVVRDGRVELSAGGATLVLDPVRRTLRKRG